MQAGLTIFWVHALKYLCQIVCEGQDDLIRAHVYVDFLFLTRYFFFFSDHMLQPLQSFGVACTFFCTLSVDKKSVWSGIVC